MTRPPALLGIARILEVLGIGPPSPPSASRSVEPRQAEQVLRAKPACLGPKRARVRAATTGQSTRDARLTPSGSPRY